MERTGSSRVAAIDVLRALTMVLMVFVNDIPGLGDTIPHWLHHAAYDEDMLGLSDIVFPGFLFCVGLSLPFALRVRLQRDGTAGALGHVAERTLALLVMGLFASNAWGLTGDRLGVPPQLLKLLSVTAFFLIWNRYPRPDGRRWSGFRSRFFPALGWTVLGVLAWVYVREPGAGDVLISRGGLTFSWASAPHYTFQYVMILLLLAVAAYWRSVRGSDRLYPLFAAVLLYLFLFRGAGTDGSVGLRPGWWQILGLIGWTYGLTAVLYLLRKERVRWCLGLGLGFAGLSVAAYLGWLGPLKGFIPGNGAFQAFSFAGAAAGLWLERYGGRTAFRALALRTGLMAAVCAAAGFLTHRFFIISKLQETAPWIFYCLAISAGMLTAVHWTVAVADKQSWFRCIGPAGTGTLTCYMLPSVWYALVSWAGITYPAWACAGAGGIMRAVVFTAGTVFLTWLLGRAGIRLKI